MIERLRDGSRIEIRPIRPDDREIVAAGLHRLSPESVYRRFLAPIAELSEGELDYLTRVDHHDHEALAALVPETQEGLGVARFVRSPDDPEVAEFAVAVADDWQHRGVGTALLHALSGRAREEGIRRFSALILSENRPMLDLLDELGKVHVKGHQAGAVEVEIELTERGLAPALGGTLRAAARGDLSVRRRR